MAWNRPKEVQQTETALKRGGRPRPAVVRGLLAGAIIVFGAMAVWWVSGPAPVCETADDAAKPTRIKEVEPANVGKTPRQPETAEAVAEATTNEVAAEKKPGVFAPGMIRLPNGFELRFKLPKEGETRQLLAGGEIWEIDSKGNIENVTPPPLFEKPFEGMLSALFERDGMVLPFALKRYSEAEVRKMCKEPTLSYDDDTPEITRKRENVAMLKKAVLDFLDAGGKFEEFVDDLQQQSQNALRAQVEGSRDIRELLLEGRAHEALVYYDAHSQEMADKGYGELKLPPSYRAALEEQRKREEKK